jgi:hypothetical protein
VVVLSASLTLFMFHPGDMWSGFEGGIIKIWPWEAIEKALSLTNEERHMAALILERSYIDLRSQLNVNGFSNIFTSDVKYLLSDNSRAKVWSAGYLSFALWYVLTFSIVPLFEPQYSFCLLVDVLNYLFCFLSLPKNQERIEFIVGLPEEELSLIN